MKRTTTRTGLFSIRTAAITAGLLAAGCGAATPKMTADPLFEAGPFTIPAGGDITYCTYLRAKTDQAYDAVTLHAEQTPGGHHLFAYLVDHPIDSAPQVCPQGGQPGWVQILATQLPTDDLTLPDGVGFHLRPNQQVVLETHYINAGSSPVVVGSKLGLRLAPAGTVKTVAAPFLFGTTNIAIPTGEKRTADTRCKLPMPLSIAIVTGHEHRYGTGVRFSVTRNGGAEEKLYQTTEWDAPPETRFTPSLDLKTGDELRVGCDWQNGSTGLLAYPHEMCFTAGIYWPAPLGTLYCISGGGDPNCGCFYATDGKDHGQGGAKVVTAVSRKETIANVKGDPSLPHHLYCALYNPDDFGALGPNDTAVPIAENDADVTLSSAATTVELSFDDVTPGDYRAVCFLDTVYGGFLSGSGDAASVAGPTVTAVAGKVARVDVKLDFAIP